MPSISLLKCIAKAVVKYGGNAVGGGIVGEFLVEIVDEVWTGWSEHTRESERRAEIEAIANATSDEVSRQISEILDAANETSETRTTVETYLHHVPATIRRVLRRLSDPTGTTVPAELHIRKSDDLLRLLPTKLPRYQPGDSPLAGVDWKLDQLLGIGGFGEVWKASNPHLTSVQPVALKLCLNDAAARVLRNEAAVLDRVMQHGKHPGIVQLRQTYLSANVPCLEYELVEGGDLGGLIQEWHQSGKPQPHRVAKVMLRLAEIMAHAHCQDPPIVHRDLKPANVLVNREQDGSTSFKIADFGIGGVATSQAMQHRPEHSSKSLFLASAVHGSYTPLYASPQQMRGEAPDPRDDIYSLGVIWYQLLTGDLRNGRPGGSKWRKNLGDVGMSTQLIELLESCFEEDPEDRPPKAADLARRIKQCLVEGDRPRPPTEPKSEEKPPEELRRLLLEQPRNISLRRKYLRRRTPLLRQADERRARRRFGFARSCVRLVGFGVAGALGAMIGQYFLQRSGGIETAGSLDAGMRIGVGSALVTGLWFGLLALFGAVAIPEVVGDYDAETEKSVGGSGRKGNRIWSLLAGPLLRLGEILAGLLLGATCGIGIGVASGVAFQGITSESERMIMAGVAGGLVLGLVLSWKLLTGTGMSLQCSHWGELGPLPFAAYFFPFEQVRRKYIQK